MVHNNNSTVWLSISMLNTDISMFSYPKFNFFTAFHRLDIDVLPCKSSFVSLLEGQCVGLLFHTIAHACTGTQQLLLCLQALSHFVSSQVRTAVGCAETRVFVRIDWWWSCSTRVHWRFQCFRFNWFVGNVQRFAIGNVILIFSIFF